MDHRACQRRTGRTVSVRLAAGLSAQCRGDKGLGVRLRDDSGLRVFVDLLRPELNHSWQPRSRGGSQQPSEKSQEYNPWIGLASCLLRSAQSLSLNADERRELARRKERRMQRPEGKGAEAQIMQIMPTEKTKVVYTMYRKRLCYDREYHRDATPALCPCCGG